MKIMIFLKPYGDKDCIARAGKTKERLLTPFLHMDFLTFINLFFVIITTTAAQLFYKKGVSVLGPFDFSLSGFLGLIPRVLQNAWLMSGIALFVASSVFYFFVLSKMQLNVVYPILLGSGIILVALCSWIFFKETLSVIQIFGMLSIIFGIYLLLLKI